MHLQLDIATKRGSIADNQMKEVSNMSVTIGLVIAFLGFLGASAVTANTLFAGMQHNSKVRLSLALIAIVAQLFTVTHLLFNVAPATSQLQFSLAAMTLLVNVLISTVLTIRSIQSTNLMLLLVTYVFSALLSLGLAILPSESSIFTGVLINSSLALFSHIVLSMAAYCVLVIASLYALQFRYIDAKLKSKTLKLNSHLPALNSVESQQFRLMTIGVFLLTLSLATGFTFLDNMFSREFAHKTVLSMVAWLMFVILTLGHKHYGWRGNNSAIVTVLAAVILTLAYFGSRFVKEILLN